MKKLVLRIIGIFLCAFMLAACDFNGTTNGGSTEITTLETPTVMLVDNLLKWNEIENASGYIVRIQSWCVKSCSRGFLICVASN